MNVYPTQLERVEGDRLRITWSDQSVREYSARELREACPCATCREKRKAPPPDPMQLPVIPPGGGGALSIANMRPVGKYAYGIGFSDGHDSGLFTMDLLQELGHPPEDVSEQATDSPDGTA